MARTFQWACKRLNQDISVLASSSGTAYVHLTESVHLLWHGCPSAVVSGCTVRRGFYHAKRATGTDKHTAQPFGAYPGVNIVRVLTEDRHTKQA